MCSLKLCENVFGSSAGDAIRSALATVAERSFFALVDACDETHFAELAASHEQWLEAAVRFDEPSCAGELSCTLPVALATQLFAAFGGIDPDGPPPESEELFDLIGEFVNMICGAWLTRAAGHQVFRLGGPVVTPRAGAEWMRAAIAAPGLMAAIDDLPFVIELRAGTAPSRTASV